MSGATCLVLIAFMGVTSGWRSLLQKRRTGDWGMRHTTQMSRPSWIASWLIGLGSIGGIVAAGLASRGRLRLRRHPSELRALGLGLTGLALVGTPRAQVDLGASWRIGVDESERTELITDRAFNIVRNPIFSGMALSGVGAALAVPSSASWLAASALVAGLQLQVRAVEEPYLMRMHGDAYREYAARTGRFVPRIGRLRA